MRTPIFAAFLSLLWSARAAGQPSIAVTIDPSADRRAISPLIYGVSFGDFGAPGALPWPLNRWGGNGTTRYSWQHDIANHASDWFFYNIESQPDPGTLPDGSTADLFIDA